MTRYLAGVFSVIAVGIVLIAYGLLSPQAAAFTSYQGPNSGLATFGPQGSMPQPVIVTPQGTYVLQQPAYPVAQHPQATYGVPQYSYVSQTAGPVPANIVRVADVAPAQERVVTRTVVREPSRNWGKTAMVIGGSSAAGAGIGGIVGGKKGALIGAAIGGGASTLYESTRGK